jgi:hypothetical protein
MAPGDVEWAVLDRGATLPDAVIVSTGSNSVVEYRTTGVNNGAPSFAAPRTTFVGTAPSSLTVADINGDGIPDMLVTNQGSNDVSVIFGSYDASGDWVGVSGPRLKSGGDGPIAVRLRDLNGEGVADLAVTNGGSGTLTVLSGVGRGFFDDRSPETLLNLGSALVQPPTFPGDSSVGYAVTATGDLVRFDLSNPNVGANPVFSGRQLLAAQALPDGQVVVALAGGIMNILVPQGNGLGVSSELAPVGGTPEVPSEIKVVGKANGLFDVLVTSQGSDTISVFSLGGVIAEPVAPSAGGPSPPLFNSVQAPTVTAAQLFVLTATATIATSSQGALGTGNAAATTSSGALSVAATSSVGLSLGNFTSGGNTASRGTGEAVLVSVEGNTYLSVPVLDFGSEAGEEGSHDAGRMPWLSSLHPFGDTSGLTRFVIGLDEALGDYRGFEDSAVRGAGSVRDPWNEDRFYRRRSVQPPLLVHAERDGTQGSRPEAMLIYPPGDPLVEHGADRPRFRNESSGKPGWIDSFAGDRWAAGGRALAGLLAGFLLAPGMWQRSCKRMVGRGDAVGVNSKADGESGAV